MGAISAETYFHLRTDGKILKHANNRIKIHNLNTTLIIYLLVVVVSVSYTHLDVYKRQAKHDIFSNIYIIYIKMKKL